MSVGPVKMVKIVLIFVHRAGLKKVRLKKWFTALLRVNYGNNATKHERCEFRNCSYDSSKASVIILVTSRAKRVRLLP